MFQNKVKPFILSVLAVTCLVMVLGLRKAPGSIGLVHTVTYFREEADEFSRTSLELKRAIALLDVNKPSSLLTAKMALKKSRLSYKKIEFFVDYFFLSSGIIFNGPAKAEVDEPYIEYQEPSGFQVMEAMLFDERPEAHQQDLEEQAALVCESAADLNSLLYQFEANDQQILESLRLSLVKVITLGITGYDAPELKSGIEESAQVITAMQDVLGPYLKIRPDQAGAITLRMEAMRKYLHNHTDFDSFNRMEFLQLYALPLQEELGKVIQVLGLDLNSKSALNYKAKNIFSPDAINITAFSGLKEKDTVLAALGKQLFFEKGLSGNLKRNCASCHHPDQYFSEQLKTSVAFDGVNTVARNAPTLLYSAFQYGQFWDGRAKTLQEQIKTVIANPLEMNGDHALIVKNLEANTAYKKSFAKAFPEANVISTDQLADALAAYLATLAPRNSAFDRYMAGDAKAMNANQLKGFNLFMGKGQCGSCHFAPLFNGLIPPFYHFTEYEVLGTPENDDFLHLKADKDKGRFGYFPVSYYQAAFKTPTVRNTEKTGPYMHNGVFKELDKVVEFYNQGGAVGLKLDMPGQTLSAKPIYLSDTEVKDIVEFMRSLTDQLD